MEKLIIKNYIIEKKRCTGCEACTNVCPANAISFKFDENGFSYPNIDMNLCVDCDACKIICTSRLEKKHNNYDNQAFAVWTKNKEVRFYSTSGGVFTELSNTILNSGGYIVGAQFKSPFEISHCIISTKEDLHKIQQSKYVQSSINGAYQDIKKLLRDKRTVLFCGAPCQVAGLKSFLNKEYSNLYTIDFICRGISSPIAYKYWLDDIEKKYNKSISTIWFKHKDKGWKNSPRTTKVIFSDNTEIVFRKHRNLYMCSYLDLNMFIRPSCANCDFKGKDRWSDITLGDFWGANKEIDDDLGTSIVIVNSKHGESLFNKTNNLVKVKHNLDEAVSGNLSYFKSVHINDNSAKLLERMKKTSFSRVIVPLLQKKRVCVYFINKFKR